MEFQGGESRFESRIESLVNRLNWLAVNSIKISFYIKGWIWQRYRHMLAMKLLKKLMPLWRNGKLRAPGRKMLVYDACRVRLESL